jgi:cobalt-zinc-cadmium efflux system outer membrane protein
LMAGVNLPVWRSKLAAGVEEGTARRLAAEESVREVTASIDGDLGNLLQRIPLLEDQVDLYENVLIVQARESLQSAESAYATGTAGALDLLDAERVLFQVRIAAARARTDLAISDAKLEGVIGAPMEVMR